ncbi:MAG: DUF4300 family protein [Dorea formicigenerans]
MRNWLSVLIADARSKKRDDIPISPSLYSLRYSDYFLFVEKIAFEQPYQATKVYNMEELFDILSIRSEYFGEEGEAGPFVYNNGEYIGTLKNNN